MLKGAVGPGVVGVGRARLFLGALLVTLLFPVAAHAAAPPYSNGHAYRHGAVPFRGHQHANSGAATSSHNLRYRGAISGVGVTTGSPRVYLVFWGSQWGTQGTNASGNATFSGDPKGMAPDLQAFFKGIGTGSESWSGVMTQYCPNLNAQYVIVFPTGTNPDSYKTGGFCAWHDYTGDSTLDGGGAVSSPDGLL